MPTISARHGFLLSGAGQAGNAADVLTPTALHPDAPSGKRFEDLTRVEVGISPQSRRALAGGATP